VVSKIDYCYEVTRDYQNIYYDISSLADDKGNKSKITEVLHRIANENPHRLIFGSDYGMCDPMAHIEWLTGCLFRTKPGR